RDLRHDLGAHVLGHRHHHVGAHVAGRDGVDGDAELRVLLRQRDGEAVHAGLGGGVVGLAVLALLAVDRADLHDAAPLAVAHALDHRAGDVEAGVEVGVHHLGPLLVAHLVEGGVAGDAGVVDEDFHRTALRFDRLDHRRAGGGIGDVAGDHAHLDAVGGHRLAPGLGLFRVAVVGGDPVPLPGEVAHDRAADAARAT